MCQTLKKWLFLTVLLACTFFVGVSLYARERAAAVLSSGDMYFYEDEGKKVPLILAPKIVLRFGDISKREKILKGISGSIGWRETLAPDSEVVVSFFPTISAEDLLERTRDVFKSGAADVAPVFILENREAVVEGVFILPTTAVSAPFIKASITKLFGDIQIHQFSPKESGWIVTFPKLFFLEGSKDPLHVLLFANLLASNESMTWKKRVRPNFRFLSDAVSAEMKVEPGTGTVGEERVLSLSLLLSDAGVTLDERLIRDLGEGDFIPKAGSIVPPPSFFKVVSKRMREEKQESYGRRITFSWRFTLFAPEKEWGISQLKIPYTDGANSPREIAVEKVTFSLLPHTDTSLSFPDLPRAKLIPLPFGEEKEPLLNVSSGAPAHFLDGFVKKTGGDAHTKRNTFFVFLAALAALFFWGGYQGTKRAREGNAPAGFVSRFKVEEIEKVAKEACTLPQKEAFRVLSGEVAKILHLASSELNAQDFSLEAVKRLVSDGGEGAVFFPKEALLHLEKLNGFAELRFSADFSSLPREEEKASFAESIVRFAELLSLREREISGEVLYARN
ncbi:MAG: hypothetical protein HYT30_00385 [Parcubacteria group bacterium]|nr:hypothetical protein [Parcubacteria group bacterium]